jgi:hypothetical protein
MAAKRSTGGAGNGVLDQFKERASEVTGLVKSGARVAKEEASERISKVTRTIKDEATRLANDRKEWAAGEIGSVGSAIHEAARNLHDNQIDTIAEYVDAAAQRFDDAAHYLEDHELTELVGGIADVVRRHPMAFIGGFLAAGVLLGRFIKAGEPPPVPREQSKAKSPRGRAGSSTASRSSKRRKSGS